MNETSLRKLTVGYAWTNRKWQRQEQQPKIIIQGAWLERAGFLIGEVVKVIVADTYIQICKATTPQIEEPEEPGDEVLPDFIQYQDNLHYEGYSDRIRENYPAQFEELFNQYKREFHHLRMR